MASSRSVWGIEIGQSSLKALKCRRDGESGGLIAEDFDYIEYPQLLSQPDADPEALVRDALKEFTGNRQIKNDDVAVAVGGQNGLARFVKLPPVEAKKVPEIVAYEAKAQIPFELEDVIWDYQKLAGGAEEEGFSMETEVGLFAMRRDQVYRSIAPFRNAKLDPVVVQLAPLATYNYFAFDDLGGVDEESPPSSEATVLLNMGVDATDLVATNGHKVWQRSIPVGGSHFTKALTKELKLTFAKAEHLKRNVAQAKDAKVAVQAMRSVYNDLVSQVQRSLGYYASIERGVKVKRIIGLGNSFRLPGLQKHLATQLEIPVELLTSFKRLRGSEVIDAPNFKLNLPAFAVSYGLVLQGLRMARLRTNLAPKEIITDKIIRSKKPWAAAGLAALLAGCMVNYWGAYGAWQSTQDADYSGAMSQASGVVSRHQQIQSEFTEAVSELDQTKQLGDAIVGNTEGRLLWLELLTALNAALPKDPPPGAVVPEAAAVPVEGADAAVEEEEKAEKDNPFNGRKSLFIKSIVCKEFTEGEGLETWWESTKRKMPAGGMGGMGGYGAMGGGDPYGAMGGGYAEEEPVEDDENAEEGPSGPGYVVQLTGYHFHNVDPENEGAQYLKDTLLYNLRKGEVELPTPDGGTEKVSMSDLGVSHPFIRSASEIQEIMIPDPAAAEKAAIAAATGDANETTSTRSTMMDPEEMMIDIRKFDFIVQFVWKPTPRSERLRIAAEREAAAAEGEDFVDDGTDGADAEVL